MRITFLAGVQLGKSPATDESESMTEDDEVKDRRSFIKSLEMDFVIFRNNWIVMESDFWK